MSEGKEKSGHMTVAMIGCLGTIAAAIITGVVSLIIALLLSETDLSTYNNYTSFVPSDPVVAKIMRLVYSATQDKQTLEGEWRDYVGRNMPDGRIQLSRQP